MDTAVGSLYLLSDAEALLYTGFADPRGPESRVPALLRRWISSASDRDFLPSTDELQQRAREELRLYFQGQLRGFSVPAKLYGTPFQQELWRELTKVSYGSTVSYGDLARRLARPGASRAVGSAVGSNPLSIFVPCHRVLPHSGRVGNYGGGPWRKEKLLALEGVQAHL